MIANYHTHTYRCNHATGTEREYIENAIESGLKILGFSDHTPQFYDDGRISNRVRMTPQMAPEYLSTIRKLADEYKNDIEIHVGFEAEYFPKIFKNLVSFCRNEGVEYLLLGQHWTDDEIEEEYNGRPTEDVNRIINYADRICEALSTKSFTYLAHADVLNFVGDEDIYLKQMEKIFVCAKKLDIPIEINMLGIDIDRYYPRKSVYKLAKQIGNKFVLGIDAHTAFDVKSEQRRIKTEAFIKELGIEPEETVEFAKI